MKKLLMLVLALMLCMACALAEAPVERNYAPEAGTGWLYCTINDEVIEFTYTGFTKSMADVTYSFASDKYTMNVIFNKKLEVGVEMTVNAVKSLELISSDGATAGYYLVKKSTSKDVDSDVLLTKNEDGLMAGTFRVMVHPIERFVGDMRPGMIQDLELSAGEFCFHQ